MQLRETFFERKNALAHCYPAAVNDGFESLDFLPAKGWFCKWYHFHFIGETHRRIWSRRRPGMAEGRALRL
jgi:hypothetical protein